MESFRILGACLLLCVLGAAGCSSDAVPLQPVSGQDAGPGPGGKPAVETLLGLRLGDGGVLLACAGRTEPHAPCLSPMGGDDPLSAGDGLYALQLSGDTPLAGVQERGSALRLGDTVESLGVVIDGQPAIEQVIAQLDALCGGASFESQLALSDGGQLSARAWQCIDAWVTLNALESPAQWHASLVLSTERGRQWLEESQAVINEEAMATLAGGS